MELAEIDTPSFLSFPWMGSANAGRNLSQNRQSKDECRLLLRDSRPTWSPPSSVGPLTLHEFTVPTKPGLRRNREGSQQFTRQELACCREQDPVPTLKRHASTSGEHAQLMAQDQQFNIASNII
jgi:hypothetical protein